MKKKYKNIGQANTCPYICKYTLVYYGKTKRCFSSFADPTRRAIIGMIAKEPVNVNTIAEPFKISDSEQREPYTPNNTFTLDLKIPAQSKLILEKSIDRHDMVCSFKLIVHNKTTGEKYIVDGKWHVILRYFNENFSVDEEVLN